MLNNKFTADAGTTRLSLGLLALLIASSISAQSADSLALPVRKTGASEGPKSSGNFYSAAKSDSAESSREKQAVKKLSSLLSDENSESAKPAEKKAAAAGKSDAPEEKSFGLLKKSASDRDSKEKPEPKRSTEKRESKPESSTARSGPDNKKSSASTKSSGKSSERTESASSKSSSAKKSPDSDKKSSAKSGDSDKKSTAKSSSRNSSEEGSKKEESRTNSEADMAALENVRSGNSSDSNAGAEPVPADDNGPDKFAAQGTAPVPADLPVASTPVAPVAATPSANLYLPQATPAKKGGILSRLFGRRNTPQPGTAAIGPVQNFNSDYATRDSDAYCPVVLSGAGLNGSDIPIGSEDAYRLTSSLPADFRPTDLVLIPMQYSHYGNPLYLRREAANSLCQMIAAAGQQGLTIKVVSAYRDYNHQLRLYTRAVARGGENQKNVARPGRSEHFLGTTVDLTNDEGHVLKRSFGETAEGRWLAANAARYGWKMTVMAGNGRRSHNDEPWHLRYLGSALNNPAGTSTVAQPNSRPHGRDVFGSIGRFLGLRR